MQVDSSKDNITPNYPLSSNPRHKYASFSERFGAIVFDSFVLFGIMLPSFVLTFLLAIISSKIDVIEQIWFATPFLIIIVYWLYSAWFESSGYMATPGKRSIGIMVTDMDGRRITFKRAAQRFFFKSIVSFLLNLPGNLFLGLLGIGYYILNISAMFRNDKRQCLHDRFAGTVVVHGKAGGIEKATTTKATLLGIVLAGSILSLTLLSFVVLVYIAPAEMPKTPSLIIDGYTISGANLEDSTGLTASQKLAAVNLSLESDELKNYAKAAVPGGSGNYVGPVKPSGVNRIEGNTYYTWSYTNLNSGLLSPARLIVNVPVNYVDSGTNIPLTMVLFVDLTGNRVLGSERVKNPGTSYQQVTEVDCLIPSNSEWYHELRGNTVAYSSSSVSGTFYTTKFKLECSPDDAKYLYPIIMDVNDFQTYKSTGSYPPPFRYGTGYTSVYNQVIDGNQALPVQIDASGNAVWNAAMSFTPRTSVVMNTSTPDFYTLIIKNRNSGKDIAITFEQIPV
jgi:uncharacterized RDD family membrane protein YckC